jgi:hypothetical protein
MDTGGIGRAAPSGWVAFAGILMLMIGVLQIIWGLVAIIDDTRITVGEAGLVVWDLTAWGWIHLIFGVILILVGGGLMSGRGWARWTAIFFVLLNAFAQIAWMTTYPIWSVLIIALDVIIIYQLTVNWVESET